MRILGSFTAAAAAAAVFVGLSTANAAENVRKPMSDAGYEAFQSDCSTNKDRYAQDASERENAVNQASAALLKDHVKAENQLRRLLGKRGKRIEQAGRDPGSCDTNDVDWLSDALPAELRRELGL